MEVNTMTTTLGLITCVNYMHFSATVTTVKVRIAPCGLETHHKATERHLPCGITQCYLSPDTGERAPP